MTVDELLAREAIRHTLAVYNTAGDRGDFHEYAHCFAPDGTLESHLGTVTGPEAILDFINTTVIPDYAARMSLDTTPPRHNLTTCRIELTGADEARAWTYYFLVCNGEIRETGVYNDRLKKIGERWLFAHRRIKIEWKKD